MLVKNTFHTLFKVSDSGLELLADFVTKSEAEEWAQENKINSYLVLETIVNHEVKITQQVTPARALRMTGEVDDKSQGAEPLKPRSGPIEGVRKDLPAMPADNQQAIDELTHQVNNLLQKINDLRGGNV